MIVRAVPLDLAFDVVVPMPLHWRKRWQRGFNQSELLAAAVARRIGAPLARAVSRRKFTPPQAGLTNAMRRTNVAGAFEVNKSSALKDRRVLLVDDVLTTGATASACASAIRRAGARRVTVITLARVDRRPISLARAHLTSHLVEAS